MADHGPVIIVESLQQYQEYVTSNQEATVVVDYWATWCGPCRAIADFYVELAKKYPHVVFLKVDVDAVPDVSKQESITAMPTFRVFKRGQKVGELIGAGKDKLEQLVASNA